MQHLRSMIFLANIEGTIQITQLPLLDVACWIIDGGLQSHYKFIKSVIIVLNSLCSLLKYNLAFNQRKI